MKVKCRELINEERELSEAWTAEIPKRHQRKGIIIYVTTDILLIKLQKHYIIINYIMKWEFHGFI